jgi:hypothetical protein
MFGQMAFREVAVTAIREVPRVWRAGAGLRKVTAQARVDRKVTRRGVASAMQAGQARDGGVAQLASLIGAATDPVHQLDTTLTPTKGSWADSGPIPLRGQGAAFNTCQPGRFPCGRCRHGSSTIAAFGSVSPHHSLT